LTVNNSTGERLRGIEAQRFSLLRNVIQLAFLYDPLVRFIGALNPILIVIACGRQKLRDPVDALYTAAAEWRGRKAYRLTDFKFVLAHRAVHHAYLASRSTFAEELDFDCRPYRNTTARNVEPFNGLYHSFTARHVLTARGLRASGPGSRSNRLRATPGGRCGLDRNERIRFFARDRFSTVLNTGSRAIS